MYAVSSVIEDDETEHAMSFLRKLIGKNEPPKARVRVCVECGMPVEDHKEWCSILRGRIEIQQAREAVAAKQ